jgi:uncharacterized OB-fold protein
VTDAATLATSRCRACGLVAFPAERYGCERCGALPGAHDPLDLPAVGRVTSYAAVHRHHQPEPATPFVVVAVDVDGGPALKGVLVDPEDETVGVGATAGMGVGVGDRVHGRFAPDGTFSWVRGAEDPRFVPPGGTDGS